MTLISEAFRLGDHHHTSPNCPKLKTVTFTACC